MLHRKGKGGSRVLLGGLLLAGLAIVAASCAQNETGRFADGYGMPLIKSPQRIRNDIVKSENYWVQREVQPQEQFPGPTPTDLKSPETDYILGPGDLLRVTIFELLAPGVQYESAQRISQTGVITLPYIGSVKCSGLTTQGVEQKLADMLEPDYLVNPQVNVFVMEFRNLNVSLLNGVFRPGQYPLLRQDTTLLEVLAQAGGVLQLVEDYGYVIREYAPEEADLLMLEGSAPPPAEGQPGAAEAPKAPAEGEAPAAPGAAKPAGAKGIDEADRAAAREVLEKMAEGERPDVKEVEAAEAKGETPPPAPAEAPADARELSRWVWSDGRWIEVKTERPPEEAVPPPEGDTRVVETKPGEAAPEEAKPPEAAPEEAKPPEAPPVSPERLALEQKLRRLGVVQGSGQLRRIIRFDVQTLQAGDPTQNIVLRDGDIITIPSPPVGDFYMAGQVARPGVYSLTGRKITLLQAVAAAGGTTAVAVPWRTEVVRRSSETEEEIIYVDLAKIARGDAPDFYVQPEDLIRVGTDQGAIFNAVLRNAFRATYGLGAVYDTNFAEFYPWRRTISPIINE